MENFQDKVKRHMVEYAKTKSELKVLLGGVWRKRKYDHILNSKEAYKYNLLPLSHGNLDEYIHQNGIKLHTDAHHLNSSQIMCLNFFFPLMQDGKLEYILHLVSPKTTWNNPKGQFEKISDIDGGQRGATNFDFYIKDENGNQAFFEIKYTEGDFGSAKDDDSHNKKWNSIYRVLIESSPVLKQRVIDKKEFFKNYQLVRNIVHVQDLQKDYVVFLVPEETLYKKAETFIKKAIKEDALGNVRVIGWKEVLEAVKNDPQLASYYAEFKKKYLDLE